MDEEKIRAAYAADIEAEAAADKLPAPHPVVGEDLDDDGWDEDAHCFAGASQPRPTYTSDELEELDRREERTS